MGLRIDISTVYEDRIKQIDIDMKKAKNTKKWSIFNKLRQEKHNLEQILAKK